MRLSASKVFAIARVLAPAEPELLRGERQEEKITSSSPPSLPASSPPLSLPLPWLSPPFNFFSGERKNQLVRFILVICVELSIEKTKPLPVLSAPCAGNVSVVGHSTDGARRRNASRRRAAGNFLSRSRRCGVGFPAASGVRKSAVAIGSSACRPIRPLRRVAAPPGRFCGAMRGRGRHCRE